MENSEKWSFMHLLNLLKSVTMFCKLVFGCLINPWRFCRSVKMGQKSQEKIIPYWHFCFWVWLDARTKLHKDEKWQGKKISEHFPPLLKFHLNLYPDLNFKLPENLRYLNHLIIYLTFLPCVIKTAKAMLIMSRGPSWKWTQSIKIS